MTSLFNKNCILTGVTDSFCLLCETSVGHNELMLHISTTDHKENIASSFYIEKYKDDWIRKVKCGYYCETCNTLLQTMPKVATHVSNSTHNNNKIGNLTKKVDEGVIIFDEILIEKQAWNGVRDDSCCICNVEYADGIVHVNEKSHILNLVQSKLELKRGKFVYRKADEFLHCLVCNSLIYTEGKDTHAEESDHVNNYALCRDNMKNVKVQKATIETEPVENKLKTESKTTLKSEKCTEDVFTPSEVLNNKTELNKTVDTDTTVNTDIADCIDCVEENDCVQKIDGVGKVDCVDDCVEEIDSVEKIDCVGKVNCVKENDCVQKIDGVGKVDCVEEITSTSTEKSEAVLPNADQKKKRKSKDKINKGSSKINTLTSKNGVEERSTAAENCVAILAPEVSYKNVLQFAKANHLKYKRNNAYCKVCDVKISSSLIRMKEHVAEPTHKEKAEAFNAREITVKKVPMIEFVQSESSVENFLCEYIIINDQFCMTNKSYNTISQHGMTLRCQMCEVSFHQMELERHKHSWKHVQGMQLTPVLKTFENEFVRELRPGVYHCGFCNFIEASLDGLKNHMRSINHNKEKIQARNRLHLYLPDIIETRERISLLHIMRLMQLGF